MSSPQHQPKHLAAGGPLNLEYTKERQEIIRKAQAKARNIDKLPKQTLNWLTPKP